MSLAAVNGIRVIVHEAINGCKNLKKPLKDCFENVDIVDYLSYDIFRSSFNFLSKYDIGLIPSFLMTSEESRDAVLSPFRN